MPTDGASIGGWIAADNRRISVQRVRHSYWDYSGAGVSVLTYAVSIGNAAAWLRLVRRTAASCAFCQSQHTARKALIHNYDWDVIATATTVRRHATPRDFLSTMCDCECDATAMWLQPEINMFISLRGYSQSQCRNPYGRGRPVVALLTVIFTCFG